MFSASIDLHSQRSLSDICRLRWFQPMMVNCVSSIEPQRQKIQRQADADNRLKWNDGMKTHDVAHEKLERLNR